MVKYIHEVRVLIKYSNEFKEEAVKRVFSGVPASQVAREIGVNVNSLYVEGQISEVSRETHSLGAASSVMTMMSCRKLHQKVKDLSPAEK